MTDGNNDFSLTDKNWTVLLSNIENGDCTPFLGAGACFGHIPIGSEIAQNLASQLDDYPYDKGDLVYVSQHYAVAYGDKMFPKREILNSYFQNLNYPDFLACSEPHGVLASLPFKLFITTNYDDFIYRALEAHGKTPQYEICRWHHELQDSPSIFSTDYTPTPAAPLVYHLHGHKDKSNSLVLTEDDYIDFLLELYQGSELLPPVIQNGLRQSLLFVGYSLSDLNLRVLLRAILKTVAHSQSRLSITLQLPKANQKEQEYLQKYYADMKLTVAWGNATEFTGELLRRWKVYKHAHSA